MASRLPFFVRREVRAMTVSNLLSLALQILPYAVKLAKLIVKYVTKNKHRPSNQD